MSEQDPDRRWDGQQWLQWNGSEWLPEVPADSSSASGTRTRPGWVRRRRSVVAASAVVAVAAVVVGVVVTQSGSGSSTASGDAGPAGNGTATSTANQDCAAEAAVMIDIWFNDQGYSSIFDAIGSLNPMLTELVYPLSGTFETDVSYQGISYAENHLSVGAAERCSTKSNPLLTQGQLQALEQLATGNDLSLLQQVTHFG